MIQKAKEITEKSVMKLKTEDILKKSDCSNYKQRYEKFSSDNTADNELVKS